MEPGRQCPAEAAQSAGVGRSGGSGGTRAVRAVVEHIDSGGRVPGQRGVFFASDRRDSPETVVTTIDHSTVERVRRREYGKRLRLERDGRVQFDTRRTFEESPFPESLPLGAETVYREDRRTDSVQVRVYDDRVTLQLDQYNPKYRPVEHAVADAPEFVVFAGATAVGAVVGGLVGVDPSEWPDR